MKRAIISRASLWTRDDAPLPLRDELLVARIGAVRGRIPILYALILVNMAALSLTYRGHAHPWLTEGVPIVAAAAVAWRAWFWHRLKIDEAPLARLRQAERQLGPTSAVLSVVIATWALLLYHFGEPMLSGKITAAGHVVLFVGVTSVSCILLLMHVARTAQNIALCASVPFSLYLMLTGGTIEIVVGVNFLILGMASNWVLKRFSDEFTQYIEVRVRLRELSREQHALAHTDPVTGLANRRQFFTCAGRNLGDSVLLIDLDGFKQINDVYGHPAGDHLLTAIGARLRKLVPFAHCVARLGGDEFALLLPDQAGPAEARALADRCVALCALPVQWSGVAIRVDASAGLYCPGPECVDFEAAYARADYALYQAKKGGGGRAILFTDDHEVGMQRGVALEQALREADYPAEIHIALQPIVTARTGDVVWHEALVRWVSPRLGAVSAGEAVELAERTGLIEHVTRAVFARTLAAMKRHPALNVSINLSACDIASRTQMQRLLLAVRTSGVDPRRIMLEITETALLADVDVAAQALAPMREMGVLIALDDFGTGYSSLAYVHRIAPDALKIDSSFVARAHDDPLSLGLLQTMIDLGRRIGAVVVAEGVERASQADLLRSLGVDKLQGYWVGRPQPEAMIDLSFADRRRVG